MSLNKYINLKRIEYVITNACTSSCRHCSAAGSGDSFKLPVQMDAAVTVIRELSAYYKLESIMTFGGEPLLYPETVCAIHNAAMAMDIPKRQVITNGFFSKDLDKINSVAKALKACGVNSLLLSVDAFHKEFLPIDKVYAFAKAACKEKIEGFKLQPAWVIDNSHNNSYNKLTYECLEYFTALNIPVNEGNNIFPSGNAAVYLSEFYEKKPIDHDYKCGTAPYTSRLDMVDCISIAPDGDWKCAALQ